MPIPKPQGGEKEDKYISRCISDIVGEYDVEGQAYAVCKSTYDRDKMSKMTDTMSKVMASVAYNTKFRGINLMAKAGDDPCWDGYEMIGMKDDGTPNCVPMKMAEVGPRGGIRESPKAPKSDTPNPNPTGEGTAKGKASGKRGAEVSAKDEETLKNKVKDFNERDSNTKNGNATLGVLKSVFQRGLGAYTGGHSPNVSSPSQWAFARVNAFLYLLKNGRPQNPKYVNYNDLLPKEHPKASK